MKEDLNIGLVSGIIGLKPLLICTLSSFVFSLHGTFHELGHVPVWELEDLGLHPVSL